MFLFDHKIFLQINHIKWPTFFEQFKWLIFFLFQNSSLRTIYMKKLDITILFMKS